MKIFIKTKKFISIITTLCLLISFVIGPTAANAMTNEEATAKYKQIFKDFMLPYNYGQITSAHYAGTDRVIINIQDLHCHPKVQQNISNIIEIFDKSFGVKNVYLEGVYGKLSTKWLSDRIEPAKKSEILGKMLDTGRLTGAEYYSLVSGKTEIISGLEEKGPYLENLKRFGEIVENQEKINLILNAMDESLSKVKKQYYTKRQYKLEDLSRKYREGTITPQKYYALLIKHTDKLGIDLSKYENTFTYMTLLEMQKTLDYSKITNELQNLILLLRENLANSAYQMLVDNTENFSKIDKLYGYIVRISRELGLDLTVNFPNLDNYFSYIEFSQKINPLELIVEEKKLVEEINTKFSETKSQREVVFLTNFEKYVRDYVSSKITADDYKYYKENIDIFRQLWNKYVDNKVLSLLDEYIVEADKFYEINTDRNIYFTDNMFTEESVLGKIENEVEAKGDVNKIIDNMKGVKEVDIVITGGFHSQTVTEILKNHGVSYIVITPNVTDGVKLAEETYYEIAKEQSKISFQTLATLPFSAYSEDIRLKAAVMAFGIDIAKELFPNRAAEIDTIDLSEKDEQTAKKISEQMKKLRRKIEESKFLESDDNDFIGFLNKISGEEVGEDLSEYIPLKDIEEVLTDISINDRAAAIKNVIKDARRDMNSSEINRITRKAIKKIKIKFIRATDRFRSQKKFLQKQELIRQIIEIDISSVDPKILNGLKKEDSDKLKNFESRRIESLSLDELKEYLNIKGKIIAETQKEISDKEAGTTEEQVSQEQVAARQIAQVEQIEQDTPITQRPGKIINISQYLSFKGVKLIDYTFDSVIEYLQSQNYEITEKTYEDIQYISYLVLVDAGDIISHNADVVKNFFMLDDSLKNFVYNFFRQNEEKIKGNPEFVSIIIDLAKDYYNSEFGEQNFKEILDLMSQLSDIIGRHAEEEDAHLTEIITNNKVSHFFLQYYLQNKDLFKDKAYKSLIAYLIFSEGTGLEQYANKVYYDNSNFDSELKTLFKSMVDHGIHDLNMFYNGLTMKIYFHPVFKELLEKEYNKNNEKLSPLIRYRSALVIAQHLSVQLGDKVTLLEETDIDKIMEECIKEIIRGKNLLREREIFSDESDFSGDESDDTEISLKDGEDFSINRGRASNTGLVGVGNGELDENGDRIFSFGGIGTILNFIENKTRLTMALDIHGSEDAEEKKEKVLKAIEEYIYLKKKYGLSNLVVVIDGHGEDYNINLSGRSCRISRTELAEALLKSYKNGANLEEITLELGACASYAFCENLLERLKEFEREENLEIKLPNIITEAGQEIKPGYSIKYEFFKNKTDTKKTVLYFGNAVYSIFRYLANKVKNKEYIPKYLTLEDVFNSDIYRSNHSIFISGQDVEKANAEFRKKLIELLGEKFFEGEETEKTIRTYRLTTIPTKFILKLLRVDEMSDRGQKIVSFLENWQIMLGKFFPIVRSMFVRMHGKENEEYVEKGFDKIWEYAIKKSGATVSDALQYAVPGTNIIRKLAAFASLISRGYTRQDFAEGHRKWNMGELDSGEEEKQEEMQKRNVERVTADIKNLDSRSSQDEIENIIGEALDFLEDDTLNEKDKRKLAKLIEELIKQVSPFAVNVFSKKQKNKIFDKIMAVIREKNYLSNEEKNTILQRIAGQIGAFELEQFSRNEFLIECCKFVNMNKQYASALFEKILSKIEFYDIENVKIDKNDKSDLTGFLNEKDELDLIGFLLETVCKNNENFSNGKNLSLMFPLLLKVDFFDAKYKNDIFAVAIRYVGVNTGSVMDRNRLYGVDNMIDFLVENFQFLNSEQQKEVFRLAIIRSDGHESILTLLLKQNKNLDPAQRETLYNKLDGENGILKNYKNINIGFFLTMLDTLTYDDFANLDAKLIKNIIDTSINKLDLKSNNNPYEREKDIVKLLGLILSKKSFLNSEQKEKLTNVAVTFLEMKEFKGVIRNNLLETIYGDIDLFSKKQQKKINELIDKLKIDKFGSTKIENLFFSPLISKIKDVFGRTTNVYRFFQIMSLSSSRVSDSDRDVFQNYKKLEAENLKTLKLLMSLSSKTGLPDIKKALENMFSYYRELSDNEKEINALEKIIEDFFKQDDIDIESQRGLHGYNINTILTAKLEDITINDLINVVHQTSIRDFKTKMNIINKRKDRSGEAFIQNFSKNGYINPEIRQLISKIRTLDGATVCFDEDTLVISIVPVDRHSTTIVVNTDNINRGITFSLFDGIEYRDLSVERMLQELGFETDVRLPLVSGKLDKTNGLNEDTDLVEKFDLLLRMFYLTIKSDETSYDLYGLDDYTEKYMAAVDNGLYDDIYSKELYDIVRDFYSSDRYTTKAKLDAILRELGLPEIPEDETILYKNPNTGVEYVGQTGINKYFNTVIDRAFSEGRIEIKNGNLVRNSSYSSMKNIEDLLTDIKDEEREAEALKQASIIDELNKQQGQILKLETKAKVGRLEYQTGYLQLSNGDYLFVKVLRNPVNGMVRYSSTERVYTSSELTSQNIQRKPLTVKELMDIIKEEKYIIYEQPREKSDAEGVTYRKELEEDEKGREIKNISVPGRLMGGEKAHVVGRVVFDSKQVVEGESILFKEFLSPDDMQGTLKAKGIVLASGMELSHQGLIVKEKGIPASIITGVNIVKRNGKIVAEVRYMEYTGTTKNINGFTVTEVVERKIIVSEGDEIAIDGKTGRVIVFDKDVVNGTSKDRNKIAEYKSYKKEQVTSKTKEKTIVREERQQQPVAEKQKMSEKLKDIIKIMKDNIKGFFDEQVDRANFGTKSTNLKDMSEIIVEIGKKLNINVRVPYGVMIGTDAFLSVLYKKGNENFVEVYERYEEAIKAGNQAAAENTAKEIIKIIENLSSDNLKTFRNILDEKITEAISKGYVSKNDRYAVRSAFKNEDGTSFSAAGVGESKVGVETEDVVDTLINIVLTSVYSDRSVAYQSSNRQGFYPAALVQQAVNSQKSAVMMVRDGKVTISGSWGQGEIVVSGEKIQSNIEVEIGKDGSVTIVDYVTERQDYQYGLNGEVKPVSKENSTREIFTKKEIEDLCRVGMALREKFGYDSDIEIAMEDGVIYVVQIRPITEKQEENEIVTEEEQDETKTGKEKQPKITPQVEQTVQQQEQAKEGEYESIVELEKAGIHPIANIIRWAMGLVGQVFESDIKFEGKIILIKEGRNIETPNDVTKVMYRIDTKKSDIMFGTVIGVIDGRTIKVKKQGNNMVFYSKAEKGLAGISESQIEELFMEAFSSGIRADSVKIGSAIAFAKESDRTSADIQDRLTNAAIDGMQRAEVEISLDLSHEENLGSLENKCKGMFPSPIILKANQLMDKKGKNLDEERLNEIKKLQEDGFRFVLRGSIKDIENIFQSFSEKDGYHLDGAILEGEEKNMTDAIYKLEELAANNTEGALHIETQMYIDMATAQGIDANRIYTDKGIIPIITAAQVKGMTGKYAIGYNEDITDEEINNMLSSGNLVNILCADGKENLLEKLRQKLAGIFSNMFGTMNELLKPKSPEQRISEETNAVSDYDFGEKFGEYIKDVRDALMRDLREDGIIKAILTTSDTTKLEKMMKDLQDSIKEVEAGKSLSREKSKLYEMYQKLPPVIKMRIQTQMTRGNYFEAIGTIRGTVNQIIDSFVLGQYAFKEEKDQIKLRDKFLKKEYKEYRQYVRIKAIQLVMADAELKLDELLNARPDTNQTVEQLFDAIRTELNKDVRKTIIANKTAIKEITDTKEIENAKTNLMNVNILLDDSLRDKLVVTKQLEISAQTVRSILAAA